MNVAATWLPAELTVVQPYSMGPVTSWSPVFPQGSTLPAMGTVVGMDRPEMMIRAAFVAPVAVQRQAQKAGETAIIMQYPKGLLEALGLVKPAPVELVEVEGAGHGGLVITPAAHAAIDQNNAITDAFLDALMALEDED